MSDLKNGWTEKHRWPPFTHGRVVCACGAVVAQCRCPQGCTVVGTVPSCARCEGQRAATPAPREAGEAQDDELWLEFIHPTLLLCGLCGNTGQIDTRGRAVSPAGYDAGGVHWCICKNGRARKALAQGETKA